MSVPDIPAWILGIASIAVWFIARFIKKIESKIDVAEKLAMEVRVKHEQDLAKIARIEEELKEVQQRIAKL